MGMRRLRERKQFLQKADNEAKLAYVRKNWQLYVFFLMPALL